MLIVHVFNFVSVPCLLYLRKDFIKFWSDFGSVIHAEPMIDSTCWLKVKVTVEGHKIEHLIFYRLHISFASGRIFINFWSNVHLPMPIVMDV